LRRDMRSRKALISLVNGRFLSASNHRQYRLALAISRRLTAPEQVHVLTELFAAADRLHVDRVTGLPRVAPRGSVPQYLGSRCHMVAVEVLA
jgi:hypothetical protein